MVLIPFNSTKESFTCQCGDYMLRFDALFNDYEGVWHFDLSDATTEEVLCYQIPVLLGAELIWPPNHAIGYMLAADLTDTDTDAGPSDLGSRVIVAYFTPEEMYEFASAL